MSKPGKQNYYDILDIRLNANQESVRSSYIRAKNAYNRDSLATYSLYNADELKQILEDIEEAYNVLSDTEKRRKYDEEHGFLSSDTAYPNYTENEEPQIRPIAKTEIKPATEQKVADFVPLRSSYQVSRPHNVDPQMEEKIRTIENVTGAFLKSVREYKQLSQEEIIDVLKISKNYLNALETDDFSKLPATVFVRGFVIQYAKALKLDHDKICAGYMRFLKTNRPT